MKTLTTMLMILALTIATERSAGGYAESQRSTTTTAWRLTR